MYAAKLRDAQAAGKPAPELVEGEQAAGQDKGQQQCLDSLAAQADAQEALSSHQLFQRPIEQPADWMQRVLSASATWMLCGTGILWRMQPWFMNCVLEPD